MPTLYTGDVIEFRPVYGCARIVTIQSLGKDGFQGVLTANRTEKAVGRYEQITRILRRAYPDVNHKTKTVGIGDDWVAWVCTCGHTDMPPAARCVSARADVYADWSEVGWIEASRAWSSAIWLWIASASTRPRGFGSTPSRLACWA